MQIKITTTLDISPENVGLLNVIANKIGYENWKHETLRHNAEFKPTEAEDFIKDYLTRTYNESMRSIIVPSVDSYFGDVMKVKAEMVKGQLDTALTTEVTITNDNPNN